MNKNTVLFKDKGDVKMIAHRGVSGLEVENTLPAFVAAGVKSYYGIETDVHVTKDGQFIVVHDDDLNRIANLDMSVENSDFAKLRAVKLKDTDKVTERGDLFLPSLQEYISVCRKYDKQAILELKNQMKEQEVWEIAKIIQEMGWFERTTFISFAADNLLYLRQKYPTASAQFLVCDATDEELQFMIDHRLDADICDYGVTKEKVDKLHKAGLKVNVWTVDAIENAERVRDCGVDMITSNILE
jgi:glycerophosphoryl diester phosphodiesterase